MRFGMTVLAAAAMFALAAPACADILTFDEPEAGTAPDLSTDDYLLKGLTFSGPYQHGVWLPAPDQHARDGSQVFENGYADLTITPTDTPSFILNGFDFGVGIYGNVPSYEVDFILNYLDGSTATMSRTATSEFQHVDFGAAQLTSLVVHASQGYIALDNVRIDGVPEPASWALMLSGFGLVGGILRSSRGRRAVA